MSEEQLCLPSISSAVDFPAKISPQLDITPASAEIEADSGENTPASSASSARAPSWSKTSRRLLQTGWTSLSVISKGTVTASLVDSSKLPTSARPTSESDSSSWPTPCARDGKGAYTNHTQGGRDLSSAVKQWPTPRANLGSSGPRTTERPTSNGKRLDETVRQWPTPTAAIATGGQTSRSGDRKDELLLAGMVGGKLNPDWVETLQGFPIGWTDGPADPETLLLFGNLREL